MGDFSRHNPGLKIVDGRFAQGEVGGAAELEVSFVAHRSGSLFGLARR